MVILCNSWHAGDQELQQLRLSVLVADSQSMHLHPDFVDVPYSSCQHFGRDMCGDQNLLGSRRRQPGGSAQADVFVATTTKSKVGVQLLLCLLPSLCCTLTHSESSSPVSSVAECASRWEAVLVVLDSRPFPDLAQILQQLDDDRVWVFAEWIGPDFAARSGSQWVPTYHSMLYNLTDEAVRACPRSTKWVVITNGDNEYSSTLFEELDHHPDADVVALDYYSRYQRPTAKPCERFAAESGKPACKQNL